MKLLSKKKNVPLHEIDDLYYAQLLTGDSKTNEHQLIVWFTMRVSTQQ